MGAVVALFNRLLMHDLQALLSFFAFLQLAAEVCLDTLVSLGIDLVRVAALGRNVLWDVVLCRLRLLVARDELVLVLQLEVELDVLPGADCLVDVLRLPVL